MKNQTFFSAIGGFLGGFIIFLYGEWTSAFTTLLILMIFDYITGLILAAVFKKSKKSETGALESNICFKGLIKKIMMLVLVAVGYRIDLLIGIPYVRDGLILAFCINEIISITENAGLMGIPLPEVINNAIDVLNRKSQEKKEG